MAKVLPDEAVLIAQLPSVVCNRFTVSAPTAAAIRISFGEQLYGDMPASAHFAAVMSASDARTLGDMIDKALLEAEDRAVGGGDS